MTLLTSRYLLPAFAASILLCSCISSEETGGTTDPIPAPTRTAPAQREQNAAQGKPVAKSPADSGKKIVTVPARISPKIKSRQDTVHASVVKKSKPAAKPTTIEVERPNNAMYTIQIGAFKQAPNALRNVKRMKDRFTDQPVYNRFHKPSGFYRVSVGRFGDAKDAFAFRKEMLKRYPKEFAPCWVNYIAR